MLNAFASKAWALGRKGAFELAGEAGAGLMSLAGCGAGDMAAILEGLRYRGRKDKGGVTRFRLASQPKPKKSAARKPKQSKRVSTNKDSPFAKLGGLTAAPGK